MRRNSKEKVVVAMSGGVDSSVAAAVLARGGYRVIGITFKTWPKEECGSSLERACCSLAAIARARAVAEKLGIPYYVLDVHETFKREVIDYFAREYSVGRTPNPCIVCNEKIKFGVLAEKVKALGARYIATGHFARLDRDRKAGRYLLREGKDKDQSYFLFSLSQRQLAMTLFPLGDYTKERVRRYAKRAGLVTYNAVPSQDICFVQDMDYREYLKKKASIEVRPGDIVDSSGKVLGTHTGIPHYTIGQRRGLGIAHREPLYVIGFDRPRNRVIVGIKSEVLRKVLIAHTLNWIAIDKPKNPLRVKAKIRYNHTKAPATVTPVSGHEVRVEFDEPQEAPTPGQAVVFYARDVVVGGGWIKEVV
jgi:tRNA-specific 2-thiouridylase